MFKFEIYRQKKEIMGREKVKHEIRDKIFNFFLPSSSYALLEFLFAFLFINIMSLRTDKEMRVEVKCRMDLFINAAHI